MKISYKILMCGLVFLLATSCDDFLDVNKNPNAPTTADTDLTLAGVFIQTGSNQVNLYQRYAGQWAGYLSVSGTYSNSGDLVRTYNINTSSFTGSWSSPYYMISTLKNIETAAKAKPGYEVYQAICKTLRSFYAQNLVDVYGDVPYTNAIKGFGGLTPSYDDAQSIYEALNVQLDSAVALINFANKRASKGIIPSASTDLMFSGDSVKWMQLANTLRLRMLLRQSEIPGRSTYITTEIAKIVANKKGFLTSDARINPGYEKVSGKQNPLWESFGADAAGAVGGRDYLRANEFAYNFFKNDPRLRYVMRKVGAAPGDTTTTGGTMLAIKFGAAPEEAINTAHTSALGFGILTSATQDIIFLSAAESYFIQAEAVQRGYMATSVAGDAQSLYEKGITAHFVQLNVKGSATKASAAAVTYYSQPVDGIGFAASADKIKAIIMQKWAAMYCIDFLEAWNDVRRLGIPAVPLSIDPAKVGGGKAPIRLLYPDTEYSTNAGEVGKKGTISQFDTKIFWDVN